MKLKLYHPWWTHLPALVLYLIAIIAIVHAMPLPDPVKPYRNAVNWIPLWSYLIKFVVAPLFIIIASFIYGSPAKTQTMRLLSMVA
jgi:hypothetical protein